MITRRVRAALVVLPVVALSVLGGCTANNQGGSSGTNAAGSNTINVKITDKGCEVSSKSFPSGQVTFKISNEGTVPNEFEVLTENKLQIVSEKENIGPGTSTELTTALKEGTYYSACKPNMVGALVGATQLKVTKGKEVAVGGDVKKLEEQAVANYTSYVKDQVGQLLTATKAFTAAYTSGDTAKAKELFPLARQHYERIEPTAEKFGIKEAGDLDGALDVRVQDLSADAGKSVTDPEVLKSWTGWHRIEADLWGGSQFKFASDADRKAAATNLEENTQKLYDLVYGKITGVDGKKFSLTINDVVTGSVDLVNEVADSKIVGEEDTFSHTDLYDFKANIEGAEVAYGNVSEIVAKSNPELDKKIKAKFKAVHKLIDSHADGKTTDGATKYVGYDTIASVQKDAGEAPAKNSYTKAQQQFSSEVAALAKQLSEISGIVLH